MSEIRKCGNCSSTDSVRFRPLKEEKWREAEHRGLIKDKWEEGIILCNKCYMNYVENPLKRTAKRIKISVQEVESSIREETQIPVNEEVEAVNEELSIVDLIRVIETMAKIFYNREHVMNKSPIYSYDELQEEFQTNE
ncbi:32552_t:CDS:1, partial [Gigaspora margarita]